MRMTDLSRSGCRRPGITLTEILIAIMILGVGLVSLATLFPIGLSRLRDASRYSRSAFLTQSAADEMTSRSLLSNDSFADADRLNPTASLWYFTANFGRYDPFIQDTPSFGADWAQPGIGAYTGRGGHGLGPPQLPPFTQLSVNSLPFLDGPGLPFAYDPLWRYQTLNPNNPQANGAFPQPPGGYYQFDSGNFEARFASGIGFIDIDPTGGLPSAHGLQRITNFTSPALMPSANMVPNIFVSPEDVVWQEPTNQNYVLSRNVTVPPASITPLVGAAPSPLLPDLSMTANQTLSDWRYSWMFTGQLVNASNGACFDGNIVVFENRPFAIASVTGLYGPTYKVEGETVVEAVFGHSSNINGAGYATGADRTVLLRWNIALPDPVVKAGDWIADVTYERDQAVVVSRWWQGNPRPVGVPNPSNDGEFDDLPAQRCFWYQVQKALPTVADPYLGANYRSMVVYVNRSLQARTRLAAPGTPFAFNAALVCPYVVNVFPVTVFTR